MPTGSAIANARRRWESNPLEAALQAAAAPSGSSVASVLARNRTWASTFAGSRARFHHTPRTQHPARESNPVLQIRSLPCLQHTRRAKGIRGELNPYLLVHSQPCSTATPRTPSSGPDGSRTHHTDLARVSRPQRHAGPLAARGGGLEPPHPASKAGGLPLAHPRKNHSGRRGSRTLKACRSTAFEAAAIAHWLALPGSKSGWRESNPLLRAPKARGAPFPYIPVWIRATKNPAPATPGLSQRPARCQRCKQRGCAAAAQRHCRAWHCRAGDCRDGEQRRWVRTNDVMAGTIAGRG